jgi:hypothetical protein
MKNASKMAVLTALVGIVGALSTSATADTTWQKDHHVAPRSTSVLPIRTPGSRPTSKTAA